MNNNLISILEDYMCSDVAKIVQQYCLPEFWVTREGHLKNISELKLLFWLAPHRPSVYRLCRNTQWWEFTEKYYLYQTPRDFILEDIESFDKQSVDPRHIKYHHNNYNSAEFQTRYEQAQFLIDQAVHLTDTPWYTSNFKPYRSLITPTEDRGDTRILL